MAGERTTADIQRDIEKSRAALARTVDQLAYRTDPKRVALNVKLSLKARAQTPAGRAVIGAAGALVAVLVVKRIRKARKSD